jgi:hypothetical protein
MNMIVQPSRFAAPTPTPTPAATSYFNSGGEGPRGNVVTISQVGIGFSGLGGIGALLDGDTSTNNLFWNGVTGDGTDWVLFDFGADKVIDQFNWVQTASQPQGTWRFEGSPDNSVWTQIDSDFTLDNGTFLAGTNTTAYRYYRLRHMSGARNSIPWLYEIRFRIDQPGEAQKYVNTGGRGDRTGIITVTATNIAVTGGSGPPSTLVNGLTGNTGVQSYNWTTVAGDGSAWLVFDFGSGKTINEFQWLQSQTAAEGTWRLEGSNDNSTYTQLGSDFTLTHNTFDCPNSTSYRYYRLRHMSGNRLINFWQMEVLFQIS